MMTTAKEASSATGGEDESSCCMRPACAQKDERQAESARHSTLHPSSPPEPITPRWAAAGNPDHPPSVLHLDLCRRSCSPFLLLCQGLHRVCRRPTRALD